MDPVTGLPVSCSSAFTIGTTTVTTTQTGNISSIPAIYQQHSASTPCLTQTNLYQLNNCGNPTNSPLFQSAIEQHQSNPSIFTNQVHSQNAHISNPHLPTDPLNHAPSNISWQVVGRNKRKKDASDTSPSLRLKLKRYQPYNDSRPLITPSQYEPIAVDDDFEDDELPEPNNASNQQSRNTNNISSSPPVSNNKADPKPPPVFIQGVVNYQQMVATVLTVLKQEDYVCRSLANDVVKINPKTIEAYRSLVSYLRAHNVVFHTYQAKQDKAYRVVLRHIHHSVPTNDIKEELQQLGYKVRNVANVLQRKTRDPLNLFFIDLEPGDDNKKIFDLQYFMHMKITVEPPRKIKSVPQCTRCQNYGHTKAYCTHPYACVKCGGPHSSVTCTKTRDTPATCALCEGSHPSNYKGCRVYKDLQNLRNNARTAQPTNAQTQMNPQQIRPANQNVSYAQALRSNINNVPQSQPPAHNQNTSEVNTDISLSIFLQEFKVMFTQIMQQNSMIMNLLNTVVTKFVQK